MIDDYVNMLQDELDYSNEEVIKLEKQVSNTQKDLQEKTIEEKTWGNLKEKKQLLFQEKSKLEEQAKLDDLVSSRYYYSTR
ncbi:MAG: flagellar FliJ family protein [Bacillus sp. (in: Bacteria)]|nr:flagellar FliJ family protein [Bacillus sp. (in: firmicutes)]